MRLAPVRLSALLVVFQTACPHSDRFELLGRQTWAEGRLETTGRPSAGSTTTGATGPKSTFEAHSSKAIPRPVQSASAHIRDSIRGLSTVTRITWRRLLTHSRQISFRRARLYSIGSITSNRSASSRLFLLCTPTMD